LAKDAAESSADGAMGGHYDESPYVVVVSALQTLLHFVQHTKYLKL
jgi:hypothetical protein